MSGYRAVLLVLFVVGGSLTAGPAFAADDAGTDSPEPPSAADARLQESDAANGTANESLGAAISSFMQSNAAEADGAVEAGMWDASFNATENRSTQQRLVERRTDELRTELTDLRDRKAELIAEREAGNISNANYKAQVGQLIGRINALQASINATEKRAEQADANVDAVAALETEANDLTGPEIAAVARNTSGLGNASGPPDGVGNGNGNGAPFRDANESPGNGVADPANRTPGPPDEIGNGNATGLPDAANGNGPEVANGSGPGAANGSIPAEADDAAGLGVGGERGPPDDEGPRADRGPGDEPGPPGTVTDPANRTGNGTVGHGNGSGDGPVRPVNRSGDGLPNAGESAAEALGHSLATALGASAFDLGRALPAA